MDNEHISTAQEHPLAPNDHPDIPQLLFNAFSTSTNLFLTLLTNTASFLRPYAPQMIPLLICILLIPLVLTLSLFAGFFVWNNVATGWESPLYLQFGDGSPPHAMITILDLIPQQRYDISVHLSIPAIESNFALGNFMTSLTMSTPSNKTLASVRRPTIVFPPKKFLLGQRPSTINVAVPMLPAFLPSSSTIVAFVEIGRRDQWKSLGSGEGREISVISASVKGSVVHHGIRGLVSRFPLTFALISAIAFLLILSVILAGCILPAMFRSTPKNDSDIDEEEQDEAISPAEKLRRFSTSDAEEKHSLRRRTRLGRSRTGDVQPRVKIEPSIAISPTVKDTSDPLRRRVSRHLDGLSD